jgi:hypothetical protein
MGQARALWGRREALPLPRIIEKILLLFARQQVARLSGGQPDLLESIGGLNLTNLLEIVVTSAPRSRGTLAPHAVQV